MNSTDNFKLTKVLYFADDTLLMEVFVLLLTVFSLLLRSVVFVCPFLRYFLEVCIKPSEIFRISYCFFDPLFAC